MYIQRRDMELKRSNELVFEHEARNKKLGVELEGMTAVIAHHWQY
jgi:hypothetical protein